MNWVRLKPYIAWLVVAVVLSLPVWLTPAWAQFKNFTQTDILQLLTSLFLIALFLERALEVFLTTLRGPDAADKELAVATARREVEAAEAPIEAIGGAQNQALLAQAREVLRAAEQVRTSYKSQTQRYALWTGLTLGLLVSAAGIRTLQPLVDSTELPQKPFFNLIDAFLTGGLIAGGSDGIHKITQVFTNFMESTANRAKG